MKLNMEVPNSEDLKQKEIKINKKRMKEGIF
jgi:hypothetical protein